MKFKKLIAMALAFAMALTLAVPAMAAKPKKNNQPSTPAVSAIPVDKIEGDDARKPIVESGAAIDTAGYPAIYIKQANDIAIIVPAGDARSDAEIIAEAAASDNSLNKQDKGTTTVIRGDGQVWLHKNMTTLVAVAGGILTVNGPISHIDFGGGKPAPEFPDPDDGTTSTVVTFVKFVDNMPAAERFAFEVYDSADNKLDVAIAEENGTYSFKTEPKLAAGTYTIKEVLTDEQANRFVGGKTLSFTVDADGNAVVAEDGIFANETKTVVEFTKTVDNAAPTENFQFDIYQGNELKVSNAFTASADHSAYTATITPKLDDGDYTIVEVLTDAQKGQYVDGKTLSFTVANGVATFTDSTINNEQLGFIEVTNPTVNQTHIKQYHETEYKWYGKDITGSTVVSYIGDFAGNDPIVKSTGASGNGFTYLIINREALAASENGLTVRIADSSPSNNLVPAMKNGNIPTYTIKINESGMLVATSDLGSFTVKVAKDQNSNDSDGKKLFAPGEHYSNANHPAREIPAGDTFCVFFHGQTEDGKGAPYETNQIKGCKFLRDDVTYDDVSGQCTYVVTVKDSQGNPVDYANGVLPGTYTVEVTATFGTEILTWEKSVDVTPGNTTYVNDLEAKTVAEVVKEIMCSCGKDLTPVTTSVEF